MIRDPAEPKRDGYLEEQTDGGHRVTLQGRVPKVGPYVSNPRNGPLLQSVIKTWIQIFQFENWCQLA